MVIFTVYHGHPRALEVFKVFRVGKGSKGPREMRVSKEPKVPRAHRVSRDVREPRVRKDVRVLRESVQQELTVLTT